MKLPNQLLNRNRFLLCILFCLTGFTAFSQTNLSHAWSKGMTNSTVTGGNIETTSVAVDAAGNTYVTGQFQYTADFDPGPGIANLMTQSGGYHAYVAKYDVNGNYVFAKMIGGSGQSVGSAIAIDAVGNLYITGNYSLTTDFNPGAGIAHLTSAGGTDIFIAKYDANGNYLFAKSVGGSTNDAGKTIAIDLTSNIYVGGSFTGTVDFDLGAGIANRTSAGSSDMFITKFNSSGDYVYASSMGGASLDNLTGMAVDANNNVVVAGFFNGTGDYDPGAGTSNLVSAGLYDIVIAKYDANGNYVFAKQIGGTDYDQANGLALDAAGNIYVSGWFRTPTVDFDAGAGVSNLTVVGADDAFFTKYDNNGNYVFAKSLGNTGTDDAKNILVDGNGNIYIIGEFSGTVDFDLGVGIADRTVSSFGIFVAKYDAGTNFQFALGVGSGMRANDLAVDANGFVNVVGMLAGSVDFDPGPAIANASSASGVQNTYLASYNSSGNYRYAGSLGGYSNTFLAEEGRTIARDAAGNLYVAGIFRGEVDFDPGAGTALLQASSTINSIYFAKYDANGNYLFAKSLFSSGNTAVKNILLDASGNIYLACNFSGYIDADPGTGTTYLNTYGAQDLFFAKYDAAGNFVFAKQVGGTSSDQIGGATLDAAGNILICGYFFNTVDFDPGIGTANLVATSNDGYIAKYDANGNYIFAKKFTSSGYTSPERIATDATGNFFIAGRLSGTTDFDPGAPLLNLTSAGGDDIFIARYDVNGNYVYAKKMGSNSSDQPYANAVDANGNTYIAGGFNGTVDFDPGAGIANLVSGGGMDIFIAKYDAAGNYVFAKSFVGGSGTDLAYNLDIDASANMYVTGYFNATVDFDGGSGTANLVSTGSSDVFITKYDANGNYIYAKSFGGAGGEFGFDIINDGAGNIYATGSFLFTADFDPNAGTSLLTSINSYDIFIAKFTECSTVAIASANTVSMLTPISGSTALTDGGCALLISITPNGVDPVSGTVVANVWIEPSVPTHPVLPFVARHYEITATTNSATATGRLTLYFTQQEFDDFNADPASVANLPTDAADAAGIANLRVGSYAGTSNDGSGLPASYTSGSIVIDPADIDIIWNSSLGRWEVSFDATGFGGFIVQTAVYALPVTMVLTGHVQGNDGLLTWKTSNEINTRSFVLERSTDGRNYTPVHEVAALNTAGNHQYQFTDHRINVLAAVVYYRLKQLDTDGRFSLTPVVALSPAGKNVLLVYPNPVQEQANLMISSNKAQQLQYRIIDYSGKILAQQKRSLTTGSNTIAINISSLPPGIYLVELKGETINERKRFIKQ